MKFFYSHIFFLFCLTFLFCSENLFALSYKTNGRIHQIDGPVEANDVNQKVLKIVLNVGTGGGGSPTCTGMTFDLTGITEMASAKLFFRPVVNDSNFSAATQIGATVINPPASISFSGFSAVNGSSGDWFYWLVIDAKASIASSVILDASLTGISTSIGGTPGFNGSAFSPPYSPTGFRFTSRNYLIGNTVAEQYPTISATAAAISRFDYDDAPDIFMEMTGNYGPAAEPGAVTLAFFNHTGPANITIRPQAGQANKVTQASPGSGVVFMYFGGAQKITLDGRAGGTGPVQWTIRNTTTASPGSTMQFKDEASNNAFQYLNIEGEGGIISIETSVVAGGTGNDNITFSNCIIRDLTVGGSATLPFIGINSAGTAGRSNDNIMIDNCRFIDIFNPSLTASACINISSNTGACTITNNHFYQTASYANLNTNTFYGIGIFTGGGHTVTGNFIGGTALNCGGTPYTISSGTLDFEGITLGTGVAGAACTVSGNTIANIAYTTTASTAIFPLVPIVLQGTADITCGSIGNGNTIGKMTNPVDNIVLTNNGASLSLGFAGIYIKSTGITSVAYNNIGCIRVKGTRTGAETDLIVVAGTGGTITIDNNTLGNNVSGDNILMSSNSPLNAIYNSSNTSGMTVTNNTIQWVDYLILPTVSFNGIYNASGPLTCTGNTFRNLTLPGNTTYNMINHSGTTATISSNIIQDISLTNNGTSGIFNGINLNSASAVTVSNNNIGSATANNITIACNNFYSNGINNTGAGALTCTGNTIQQINMTSTGVNPVFQGISTTAGVLTFTQNTIQNITCASTGSGNAIIGIYVNSASAGHLISKNTVTNLTATSSAAVAGFVTGIRISAGSGTIQKNLFTNLKLSFNSLTAEIDGIDVGTGNGNWDLFNNVALIDNGSNTNSILVRGVRMTGTGIMRLHHNTLKVAGSVASGAANTAAFFSDNTGTKTVNNNIFLNTRTGTGKHYAVQLGSITGLAANSINTNYIEVANNQSQLCYNNSSDNAFAAWNANAFVGNDLNGAIALDAIGKVVVPPDFIGAGTGTNLTATVVDDRVDVVRGAASWMGAYEGQNITVNTISPLAYCAGTAVSVPYIIGGTGSFNNGNIFTAYLSDAAGSFASQTNIGALASTTSGTIAAILPLAISGSSYRIRVMSSDPIITGSYNGANINIQTAAPGAPAGSPATGIGCSGFTANWSSAASATTYFLDVSTVIGFGSFVPGYNNLDVGNVTSKAVTGLIAGTNYYYRVRAGNGCGTSASSAVTGPVLTTGTQGIYVVTTTAFGTVGDGISLRWAITQSNTNCGHDIIKFNLGAGGPFSLTVSGLLPNLNDVDGVTIDGFDNGAFSGVPNTIPVFNATVGTPLNPVYKIILNNTGTVATGLIIPGTSNNNIIKGLVLQNFGDGTMSANDIAITINGNNNQVLGCYIGMDVTGTTRGIKTAIGIDITGANNITGDGTAAGANLISGMNGGFYGIRMTGAAATGNIVKGNMIGLQKDGTSIVAGALQGNGIYITTSSSGNTIGGSNAGEGNVISGNNDGASSARGLYISTANSGANNILGNIIGLRADGVNYVSSNAQSRGIEINYSHNNIIGGNTALARNIISGNEDWGIIIGGGVVSTGNVIKGNYIGIAQNGTTFITGSTQDIGVLIAVGSSTTIGGSGAGEGNVISGNKDASSTGTGVYLNNSFSSNNTVLGNIIGPQVDGVTYLASNAQYRGIEIDNSPNNIIGGNTTGARNIISANETYGVYILGASSTGNIVKGNYIGIAGNGTTFITNSTQDYGVYIDATAGGTNTIGGSGAGEGNVISGNKNAISTGKGIYLLSTAAAGNTVLGNIIGPQADGVTYLSSNAQTYGIYVENSRNNIIGGNTPGARNIISANETDGVLIGGAGSTGNVVQGNYIGIDKNGTTFIATSTQDYGIYIYLSAASNSIGGSGAGEGNVISGNIYGIFGAVSGVGTIWGNIIGPQADGVTYLASNTQNSGIYLSNSSNNTIGGNTALTRNIISANEVYGVYITGASSTGNVITGNYIGPGSTLATIAGSNQDYGVYLISSAANNTIGSTAAGEENQITFNAVDGVYVFGAATNGNKISGNPIYSNTGKAINLNYGVNQGNNGKAAPAIATSLRTNISGTSGATDVIEIFKNNSGNCNNANTYVGSATAVGGIWSLPVSLAQGDYILATARDGSNNTSEFSTCSPVISDLYWVGGNGMWNNPANWSYSSGGAPCTCIPNINSNVFIDNNSGTVIITMPVGAWYTKGFTMSGAGAKTSIIGQGSLLPRP